MVAGRSWYDTLMGFAPAYIIERFFYRIGQFFHHWYIDGTRVIADRGMMTLAAADHSFAVKITWRHFFEPLYKDYSIIGRILGILFRTGRILIGIMVYVFIVFLFGVILFAWYGIPAALLFAAVSGMFT